MPMLQLTETKKHTPKTSTIPNACLVKADFIYNEENDQFTCPHSQILPLKKQNKNNQRIYQGSAQTCANCPYYKRCCQSKKGEARTITTDSHESLRQQMRERMAQDESLRHL